MGILDAPSLSPSAAAKIYAKPSVPAPLVALSKAPQPASAATLMQPWYAALARRSTRRATVAFIGDSWTEGQGATSFSKQFTQRLAAGLRGRFSTPGVTGGRGWITPGTGTTTWSDYPASIVNYQTGYNDYSGPNLYTLAMHPGTPVVQVNYSLVGSSADIMYPIGSSYGTISYAVDGGAATNIAQANASIVAGQKTNVSLGTAGSHTLNVTGVTSGSFLNGIVEYNGDENAGITVHGLGRGGFKSSDWSSPAHDPVKNWPGALNALRPDVVFVELGINDNNGAIDPAVYQTNMQTLLASIRSGIGTNIPVVFFVPPSCKGKAASWPAYAQALYNIVAADGNSLIADLSLRIPASDATPSNYGLWYPTSPIGDFHLSDAGHQAVADALLSFLTP